MLQALGCVPQLDAAGLPVPDAMQGRRLLNAPDGDGWDRDGVLIQSSQVTCGRALATDRWKYAVHAPDVDPNSQPAADQYVERYLYDLRADPAEQTNLVGKREYQAVAAELRHRLRDRIEAVEGESTAIEPMTVER